MKYLKFTYVDASTGISVASEPALNGTKFPAVAGLMFIWARESAYPTEVPEFFGTCPDASNTQIDGVLGLFEQGDWEQMQADETNARPSDRDRAKVKRQAMVDAITVTTQAGHTFQGDETSINRMNAAITVMKATGSTVPWVLADNTVITVDVSELTEALALSGAAVAAVWVI